ncbi:MULTISPECIES: hypothetical protein [unclassified Ensifer]|uniref:hypothetical protein n=1 Tax=unclassified Ensifer TaxID=2633371 RepID=UPI000812D546|nr:MULTISPECIES: hypothetical protein [unclassified Ensifer]OCP17374.1 hypothetical protein BC361_07900 [Ensifer sp. LC54]OCP28721.1 hypothetical protein BC363_02460 [Ensifer sp. LC384]
MKFKLVSTYSYSWPATARIPSETQPGKIEEQKFILRFEVEDRNTAIASAEAIAALPEKEQIAREHDLLRRVIKGWDDVEDDGKPVTFSPQMLEAALLFPWFRAAAYRAYANSLNGEEEARLGN